MHKKNNIVTKSYCVTHVSVVTEGGVCRHSLENGALNVGCSLFSNRRDLLRFDEEGEL